MKQSKHTMKIMMAILLIGVLLYFGIYIVRAYQGGISTILAYTDTVNVGVEATGYVVRDEFVITTTSEFGNLIDYTLSEGEKVAKNGEVAALYSTPADVEIRQNIRTLENEVEQLRHVLSAGEVESISQLETDLQAAIAKLKIATTTGNLYHLSDNTLELRTLIFQRAFTFDSTGTSVSAVVNIINNKLTQISQLYANLGAVSSIIYAPETGYFSSLVDGYESRLTPETLKDLTPSQYLALTGEKDEISAQAVGRLTTSSTWYFTTLLDENKTDGFNKGQSYTVCFDHDWSGKVAMTLEHISQPENGKVAVVFSCHSNLSNISLLRKQTVDIIISTHTGIRVPSSTVRTITQTVTNSETGEREDVVVTGVYVAVGATAEFKPVNILWHGDGSFLVEPKRPLNTIASNDRLEAEQLQVGDEVILSTAGIYDGKVIR